MLITTHSSTSRWHMQERIKGVAPKFIVLSGGPNSVHVEGSPRVPQGFFEYVEQSSIPVLGICYGMQMLVQMLGGQVEEATNGGEYGRMPIDIEAGSSLFSYTSSSSTNVWMSHGDEAVKLPDGFKVVAKSRQVRHQGQASIAAQVVHTLCRLP
jgi:GMP synthase (glutamine-hydrolysing)